MATKTRVTSAHDGSSTQIWRWSAIAAGETGEPVVCAAHQDKSVQFLSMDGSGVTIQGTLNPDIENADWHTLNDPQGNALTSTENKTENVLEHVYAIRPLGNGSLTAGTVWLLLGSSR